ncbi:MAG: hypothetical protein A2Y62_08630 [Candidatus Fischerbacteria bacterium RBG_13_37_8]|uniref:Helix-turn-helix domain-containing protein n=1 Tax=Candidatus Fischerbacteria bacterium RBG_13_37_8 TaxID=1817863 RepID=A0A1F5VR30_9BACT|nr:MAG: hypothetical protein A2Y62_08630 [Candidatus Fischerbacteria bacterium RBG_13_37_8]
MSYYLTVRELAKLLRIGENAARTALKQGKFPSIKIGRHYLVSAEDVKNILPHFDAEAFRKMMEIEEAKRPKKRRKTKPK